LYQHSYCYHLFNPNVMNTYSEQSYILNFWGYLFETYFGERSDICQQWGDTISDSCKDSNLNFKLDLQIIVSNMNHENIDLGNAEFAKQAVTNKNKYYNDKTKSLLAAKVHLNHIITNTKHLPPQIARNMPVLQTIGTSCRIFVLSLVNNGVYLLRRVHYISYPITNHEIKKNDSIQKIIIGLALVEVRDTSKYR
ncbi:hypothetical protein INT48_005562, partial [Thamnidium elegans]